MPDIRVSEDLYRQIEDEADGGDIEATMWRMVGKYRRGNNPGD
jgi:hypothetical protein